MSDPIFLGKSDTEIFLLPSMANRHGLTAGATGTGKTITLQVLAEAFSERGVPVFLADVKGDLSGLAKPGATSPKAVERATTLKLEGYAGAGYPVVFWDVFGESGHPVRSTISEMGPLLLARLLNLNETQEGVLTLVFKIADDNGLLLLDMKDLRAALNFVGENAAEFTLKYGRVSSASVGAIQRNLLALEQQGADKFFGEPALNLDDFLQTDPQGRGQINVLAAERLMQSPRAYAAMLLWMLSELYETLPEVGDPEKPKLVFFFDEAHLLFTDIPPALQEKIEQVVRLIRSKGVGIFFVSQNPIDIPDKVLGQLGNRVQHALRAFTPRDQKAVKVAAETFRANPALDTEAVLTQLGVGEALVSTLDAKGQPGIVQRTLIRPPCSQIGPITPAERQAIIQGSLIHGTYEKEVDRESAFELLQARAQHAATEPTASPSAGSKPATTASDGGLMGSLGTILFGSAGPRGGRREGALEAAAKSAARSAGTQIMRGILGSIFGKRR